MKVTRDGASMDATPLSANWREGITVQCEVAERAIVELWGRGTDRLKRAASELEICLELFLGDLDKHPLFSSMPRLRDDFDYLWMLFLECGGPKSWGDDADSSLHALTLGEFCLAFASFEIEQARYMCSPKACSHWTPDEARDLAVRNIRAASRAIAVARPVATVH